jgi:hypothetical protein
MAEPTAAEGGDGELEDEMWGNLRLRRGGGKSGYYGVTKVNSKKRPFQAWIKSATRKQQGLGSFATAQRAAIEVAKALAQQDGEDLDSPRKQKPRGARAIHTRCSTLSPMTCHVPSRTPRTEESAHATARHEPQNAQRVHSVTSA